MSRVASLADERIWRRFQERWGHLGMVHPRTFRACIAEDVDTGALDAHGVWVVLSREGLHHLPIVCCDAWVNTPMDFSAPMFGVDR